MASMEAKSPWKTTNLTLWNRVSSNRFLTNNSFPFKLSTILATLFWFLFCMYVNWKEKTHSSSYFESKSVCHRIWISKWREYERVSFSNKVMGKIHIKFRANWKGMVMKVSMSYKSLWTKMALEVLWGFIQFNLITTNCCLID